MNSYSMAQPSPPVLNLWALSGEIGIILALPLVVLIIAGVKLDKYLGTTPLFIILAMIVSAVSSTILIARKIKRMNNETTKV